MSSKPQSPDQPGRIDADEIWAKLDDERENGDLARRTTGDAEVVYGASTTIKGGIVAYYRDGRSIEGTFREGIFIPNQGEVLDGGKGPGS